MAAQAKPIIDAGVPVVEILSTYAFQATTRDQLNAWIETPSLNVSAFIDAPETPMAALQAAGIRETAFIVEMPSMKILYVDHGDVTGQRPSTITAAFAEVNRILGN